MTECTSLDVQPNASAFKRWLSVISLAFGTFVLINTEFLPIGLLTPTAHSLNVSEGRTGLAVMLPGLAAAASALLLILFSRQLNRRTLLLFLSALVIFSNAAAMLAPSFGVLLIGRIILGVAVGGFWSFAIPAGRRLVPEEQGARATSLISAGVAVGTVAGLHAGALDGEFLPVHLASTKGC